MASIEICQSSRGAKVGMSSYSSSNVVRGLTENVCDRMIDDLSDSAVRLRTNERIEDCRSPSQSRRYIACTNRTGRTDRDGRMRRSERHANRWRRAI